jgi:molecular chaperone Hsp33
MADLLIAASSPDAGIAISAAVTTELVAQVQRRHDLWPTASAAVGRLVTAAILFGPGLKGRERVSLQVSGDGPIGSVSAEAWLVADDVLGARGAARVPHVDLPIDARGKFDVAGAVGKGSLQVTKSYEVGQPYVGVVPLHSGEIAEDIAAYLSLSEQIPSVVALGVLANPSGIIAAGGIIAQVLPGADEATVARLEERALAMPPVTELIANDADAHGLLRALGGDVELRSERRMEVRFACLCTQEKVEAALLGLDPSELLEMAGERERTEVTCEYCKHHYYVTAERLRALAGRDEETAGDV